MSSSHKFVDTKTLILVFFLRFSILAFVDSSFTSCYVSNYTCNLSRQQESSKRYRNILTCTSTQERACFPNFGAQPTIRLSDSDYSWRRPDLPPHQYDFRHVDTLNLYADLTQLPTAALINLPSLETLSIDRSPIQSLENRLLSIDIHWNAFAEAESLRELKFRHVDFSKKPQSDSAFESSPEKKRRRRRHRKKRQWSKDLGESLKKADLLTRLSFDRCRFDKLDRQFFGDQYVTELSLISCTLSDDASFANDSLRGFAESLEQLIIKDTPLPDFPYAVRWLKSLTKLILSGCRLKNLPDEAFAVDENSSLPTNRILQELDLSFNRLENLGPKSLRSLIDLGQLNLEGNPLLVEVPDDVFIENRRLKSLDFRECSRLPTLTDQQLRGLESLIRLSLRNCRSLKLLQVRNLNRLRELNAQSCAIETLTKGVFGRQQRFADGELSLNDNPLTSIDEGAFDGVDLPRSWSLQNTRLTHLDLSRVFSGATSLTSLELKQNSLLTNITVSDLKKTPSTLRELIVGSNGDFRLSDFGGTLKRFLIDRKAKLVIDGASLCSCEWQWLTEVKPFVSFRDGGHGQSQGQGQGGSRWWSVKAIRDAEDGAYCCNAVIRKNTNDTLPLYSHAFLATINEYCGGGESTKRDRLSATCNSGASISVSADYDFLAKLILTIFGLARFFW